MFCLSAGLFCGLSPFLALQTLLLAFDISYNWLLVLNVVNEFLLYLHTLPFVTHRSLITRCSSHTEVRLHAVHKNFILYEIVFRLRFFFPKLACNGLQLQEVGDFEALNGLPPPNLLRSTKLHLTTEPTISCRCCYQLAFCLLSLLLD